MESVTTRPGARVAAASNAGLAWFGMVLVVVLSAVNAFDYPTPEAHLYGIHPAGLAAAVSRVADTLSYFTIWSNLVVAVAMTLIALAPDKDTVWRRALHLDSLLMITVTAIVYALLLAPSTTVTGWSIFTNPLQHIAVPAVTVIVWLVWGPRVRLTVPVALTALVVPVGWIVFMLIRGAIVDAYPYGFVNVATLGWGSVLATLAAILAFGAVVGAVFAGVDALRGRASRTS